MGRPDPPDSGEESPAPRIVTPVYRRDPFRPRQKSVVVKTSDDVLVDLMMDGEYRDVSEVARLLSGGRWVDGVQGCLRRGYSFDRDGTRWRMRRRGVTEREQTLFELVEGVTADDLRGRLAAREEDLQVSSSPESSVPTTSGLEGGEPVDLEGTEPVMIGEPELPEGGARLFLSGGNDPLTLSLAECSATTAAILAKRSSGKTYFAMVLVEEILRSGSGMPVVVVDPMGVWAPGLRCMADGTPSPYQILTLGGPHGDFPLQSFQGRLAGEVVEQLRPHPVVLDLSDMEPAEQHEVMADFGERIFATDKRTPILYVVDEADEFIPQELTGSPHQKRSLKVWDRIVRRGRIKGLGTVLISQRAAVVNKNVLSQIDKLFLLCMVAPSDLDAVEDWLRHVVPVGQRSQCLGQLPSLQPGQAFYMAGGAAVAFRKFMVRRRDTYDSSRTPDSSDVGRELALSQVSPEVMEKVRGIIETFPNEEVSDGG